MLAPVKLMEDFGRRRPIAPSANEGAAIELRMAYCENGTPVALDTITSAARSPLCGRGGATRGLRLSPRKPLKTGG
jgi:hypothetical protein